MTIEAFVDRGFTDHSADPEGVFSRLPEGLPLLDSPRAAFLLANLATHVGGEHLGQWDAALAFLRRIEASPAFDAATPEAKGVRRLAGVLHLCAGRTDEAERCLALAQPGGGLRPESARIRMLVVAAAALGHQGRTAEAEALLDEALALASYGPTKDDPVARELAVVAHNIAAALPDLPDQDEARKALYLRAARISRQWWEVAGNWMNVERAEYRLAMCHLAAGLPREALAHAQECLRIVLANGAEPFEAFFGHWTVARAEHALGDGPAARRSRDAAAALLASVADDGSRAFCAEELSKLDALLPR